MSREFAHKRSGRLAAQVMIGAATPPPPLASQSAPAEASGVSPRPPEADVVPLHTPNATEDNPRPTRNSNKSATHGVRNQAPADAAPTPRGAAPPVGAVQQGRFQVRVTEVVANTAAETAWDIRMRTGWSLNRIREIAVWWALCQPDSTERFVQEVAPAFWQARREATERLSADADT